MTWTASNRWTTLLAPVLTLTLGLIATVQSIDCYKCTSINAGTAECEDTFDREIGTVHLIERDCFYGLFKGTHCIKFKGEREDGTKVIVRDCSDSDWGSHCGDIRYLFGDKEQMITGCLEACHHDGCNKATLHASSLYLVLPLVTAISFLIQDINLRGLLSSAS